jgi:uncharacterized phage protein (TIGR01671 family)
MKEIKFRAWDKIRKKMYDIIGFIKKGTEIRIWYEIDSMIYNESFYEKNLILMQYTGLKEKNGKEIYEGDILKCESCSTLMVVKWYNESAGFNLAWTEKNIIEIIGNIYENKELLNENNEVITE